MAKLIWIGRDSTYLVTSDYLREMDICGVSRTFQEYIIANDNFLEGL